MYWPLLFIEAYFIIAARKHYTVDIIVSLYTTPLLWNASFSIIGDYKSSIHILQ
jgi:hypothetical protein